MTYHRAVDATVWVMPLMNFKFYIDALAQAGVEPNDIEYNSKVQDWRFQTATPNNTTPYIHAYWNINYGPVVFDMPASVEGIGIFGTVMDAWQRPLDDVGSKGRDHGLGAKYFLVPANYDGPLLRNALVYEPETNFGFSVLRPIIAGGPTEENLAEASALTKQIKVYPLSKAGGEAATNYVDVYSAPLEMTPKMDGAIYGHIHEMIGEEVVLDHDFAMMGALARIGIKRNEPFEPDADLQAIYNAAGPEALEYMMTSTIVSSIHLCSKGKSGQRLSLMGRERRNGTKNTHHIKTTWHAARFTTRSSQALRTTRPQPTTSI
ncbi:DUF1254 domain-containing protein [Phaeobacter sp. NW0010-22]|uniref:DUF1254 domain-containing protein n=1 Tax=Phaeobacter sp. NW0010-22 TaxID=3135907 RepID=UPI0033418E4D